jgi:hypothetical protein
MQILVMYFNHREKICQGKKYLDFIYFFSCFEGNLGLEHGQLYKKLQT